MKFRIDLNKYTIRDKNYEKEEQPETEDDYLVKSMGAFGRWQAVACFVMSFSRLIAMWNIYSYLFLTPPTKFRCKTMKNALNSTCYDSCSEYELRSEVLNRTITSEFSLICNKAWMASFTQTIIMFGVMVGVAVIGWISDRFGRSKAIALSSIINVIFMFGASYAPDYWSFNALRFLVGIASGGMMSITAVYTLEMVGPQYRELAGTVALIPDDIAEASLALFAYLATSWNVYLLEFSGITVAITVLLCLLPETPRWLMANGKAHKAVDLMTKAAKFNKLSTSSIKDNVDKGLQALHLKENESQNLTYLHLFKTKTLSIITMSAFAIWFVSGLCFYGLNQYTTLLGSNVFVVVALSGIIQLPMSPFATVISKVYGRKAPLIYSYVLIGITMFILIFLKNESWESIIIGLIGILFCCVNLCILYIYTIEVYPTPMRNMGFSLTSLGAKLGAMIAPFIVNMELQWVSSLIIAIISFVAAAICLLLPETKNRKLRDTVDD